MAKFALIINGDTEARHLGNVGRALEVLEGEGYETFVASRERPSEDHDHYVDATVEQITTLIEQLKGKIGKDDELVIYTTGHGESVKNGGGLCLQEGCDTKTMAALLDSITYGQRTVVMDQCYGGNWSRRFTDDPKTLFVAAGSKNQSVCCHEFAPRFWSDDVPDTNDDGKISWQERFAYAFQKVASSNPQHVVSRGYRQVGDAPFPEKVVTVDTVEELGKELKRLHPGQFAIVTFSADWCGPCKLFAPEFDDMATASGGQHLWIRTENEDLAAQFQVRGYPTVVIFDGASHSRHHVEDRATIFATLAKLDGRPAIDLEVELATARSVGNFYERSSAYLKVLRHAEDVDVKEAPAIYEGVIDTIIASKRPEDFCHLLPILLQRTHVKSSPDMQRQLLGKIAGALISDEAIEDVGFESVAELADQLHEIKSSKASLALYTRLFHSIARADIVITNGQATIGNVSPVTIRAFAQRFLSFHYTDDAGEAIEQITAYAMRLEKTPLLIDIMRALPTGVHSRDKAIALTQSILTHEQAKQDIALLTVAGTNLAHYGETQPAITTLHLALEVARSQHPEGLISINSICQIGGVLRDLGDHDLAFKTLALAQRQADQLTPHEQIYALGTLARSYGLFGRPATAEGLIHKAEALVQRLFPLDHTSLPLHIQLTVDAGLAGLIPWANQRFKQIAMRIARIPSALSRTPLQCYMAVQRANIGDRRNSSHFAMALVSIAQEPDAWERYQMVRDALNIVEVFAVTALQGSYYDQLGILIDNALAGDLQERARAALTRAQSLLK